MEDLPRTEPKASGLYSGGWLQWRNMLSLAILFQTNALQLHFFPNMFSVFSSIPHALVSKCNFSNLCGFNWLFDALKMKRNIDINDSWGQHCGVVSTAAPQKKDPGFKSCGIYMFSLCPFGFFPGTLVSPHNPKTCILGWLGNLNCPEVWVVCVL